MGSVQSRFAQLEQATASVEPPFGVVDLTAFRDNAGDLVRRAAGKPVRVASKSVRCRQLLRAVLAQPGFHGVLAYTLAEALWLAEDVDDVVVGYPTVDRFGLWRLSQDAVLAQRVTLMVDSVEHLDLIDAAVGSRRHDLRVCLDLDASLRMLGGRVHVGARRSPVHSPEQARELAYAIEKRDGFRLVGLMAYEGQVAGIGDDQPGSAVKKVAIRRMRARSVDELRTRRAAVVAAVRDVAELEFVNGGGTGSLESTAAEDAVTEVAAGSGLYGPALFDGYQAFQPRAAAFFVLSVVRRPAPTIATVLGGGWVASGPHGRDRLPTVAWPAGLTLLPTEGAGEVQTPVRGAAAGDLKIGDRVWFRHAKAGELCEHLTTLHLVEGDELKGSVPTYRGEAMAFL